MTGEHGISRNIINKGATTLTTSQVIKKMPGCLFLWALDKLRDEHHVQCAHSVNVIKTMPYN
jgi:hypothetical protein